MRRRSNDHQRFDELAGRPLSDSWLKNQNEVALDELGRWILQSEWIYADRSDGASANNSMRLHFWQTRAHAELFSQSIPMKVMPLVFMSISLLSNSSCPQIGHVRGISATLNLVEGVMSDLAAALRPAPIPLSEFVME